MQSDKCAYISHSIGRVSLLKYVILPGVVTMALQCAAPACIYKKYDAVTGQSRTLREILWIVLFSQHARGSPIPCCRSKYLWTKTLQTSICPETILKRVKKIEEEEWPLLREKKQQFIRVPWFVRLTGVASGLIMWHCPTWFWPGREAQRKYIHIYQ